MELKEHLHKSRLTSNAAVLFVWITLSARQGRLEASYQDLMHGLGWSRKMLQRTIAELTQKQYIRVTRATSQRSKMLVEALIDFEESVPGVDKDVHADTQESSAADKRVHSGKSGVDKDVHGSHTATAVVDTGVLSTTQEVPDVPPGLPDSAHVAAAIPPKCLFTGELSPIACQTLAYIGFECDRRHLSIGFVSVLDWLGKRQHLPLPGILATMILDRCLEQQRRRRNEGKNPLLYAWPADWQKRRDILRKAERAAGKAERARAAA